MRHLQWAGLGTLGLVLLGCAGPPELPPPPPAVATIGLRNAMMQTVDALAAARAHAAQLGQRSLRACEVEAVFHVIALPVTEADGTQAARLVLAPPDHQDGPHSSTVTLTLAGDPCGEPESRARR